MTMDGSGNIYITGNSDKRMTTFKYDSSGNLIWFRQDNRSFYSIAFGISLYNDGSVYIAGGYNPVQFYPDCIIVKYNQDGNQIWSQLYGGMNNEIDFFEAVATDNDGNVYGVGYSGSFDSDYLTIKYDNTGKELWVRKYDEDSWDYRRALSIDIKGNVFVIGQAWFNIATVKYNSSGEQHWVRQFDYYNYNYIPGFVNDDSGNVYVTTGGSTISEGCNYITV